MKLECRPYSEKDKQALQEFECSKREKPEEYELEISDWIKDKYEKCISDEIAEKSVDSVFVYELVSDDDRRIIAYGALANDKWAVDPGTPAQVSAPVVLIAMLGLHKDYQGKPEGVPKEQKYSYRILSDMIRKAAAMTADVKRIGLWVHPENIKAINLYKNFGFEEFPYVKWLHPTFGKEYLGMLLLL